MVEKHFPINGSPMSASLFDFGLYFFHNFRILRLSVDWVSLSRSFIGFSGTAADLGRAFQTDVHTYTVGGVERMSVSSDPTLSR